MQEAIAEAQATTLRVSAGAAEAVERANAARDAAATRATTAESRAVRAEGRAAEASQRASWAEEAATAKFKANFKAYDFTLLD